MYLASQIREAIEQVIEGKRPDLSRTALIDVLSTQLAIIEQDGDYEQELAHTLEGIRLQARGQRDALEDLQAIYREQSAVK